MQVDSPGETTIVVRADAPEHAPRLFRLKVKRVKDLAKEAKSFKETATDSYDRVIEADETSGLAVALEGTVEEARTEHHVTVILLEVKKGCDEFPCLARLIHGAKDSFKRGEKITAYGNLQGTVDGPRKGQKVPEIRVDFILPGHGH
jgi:hypothetical protein